MIVTQHFSAGSFFFRAFRDGKERRTWIAERGLRNAELPRRDAVKVVQYSGLGWPSKRRHSPKERSKRFAFHLRFGRVVQARIVLSS